MRDRIYRPVTAPIWIIHGSEDQIVPYVHAARLREAFGGARHSSPCETRAIIAISSASAPLVWQALEGTGPVVAPSPRP